MPEIAGLYYETHGNPSAPPLLLSSGLGGSANFWAPNIAHLTTRYRVIAYDHRGTGRSDREVPGTLTIDAMADDVVALMDGLGLSNITLVGHAIGGMLGLALALRLPGRLHRLVVVNGWAKLDPHTARCFDARLALLRDSGPRAYLRAQPLFLYPPQWNSEHHDRLSDEEESQLAHFPGAEMVQRRIAAARLFDIEERLPAIGVRTLFVAADDDMLVPPHCSVRMAEAVPHCQLAEMTSGGHACTVTRADHFDMWVSAWLASE